MVAAHAGQLTIIHGSTFATNTALEGKGVRTAFITNRGFKDMLTIGRQTRRELYNLQPTAIAPPCPTRCALKPVAVSLPTARPLKRSLRAI